MKTVLSKFGNMPMTSTSLAMEFPNIIKTGQKLSLLEKNKDIIRLKRGLYVCNPDITGIPLSLELIANRLLTPSYVSMSAALRYYGLIPEAVYVIQSVTTKESRGYDTPVGRFVFTHVNKKTFNLGIRNIEENEHSFLIASPEKALCDLVAETKMLNLRFRKEALSYLEEYLRFDMDSFYKLNPDIFIQYIALKGKKYGSIKTLLSLLRE